MVPNGVDTDRFVPKRFTLQQWLAHLRRWIIVSVLAEHAPGLAPIPVSADLDGLPPTIVMSKMPGASLRGTTMTDEQMTALASALAVLHSSVPTESVETLQPAA